MAKRKHGVVWKEGKYDDIGDYIKDVPKERRHGTGPQYHARFRSKTSGVDEGDHYTMHAPAGSTEEAEDMQKHIKSWGIDSTVYRKQKMNINLRNIKIW